jgi:putative CocE/NonD family hydrolase
MKCFAGFLDKIKWRYKMFSKISTALFLLVSVFFAAALNAQTPEPYAPASRFNGVVESSQYITSFDGTQLAVSIRRPTLNGEIVDEALPVIVTQDGTATPRGGMDAIRYFTDQGYVWIAQDRRGTGASFGIETGFVDQNTIHDAKAVIEWAGSQPFSSGKVVAMGCSNQGIWQYGVAGLNPDYLVAIVPACASPEFFGNAVIMNGVPIFPLKKEHYQGECTGDTSLAEAQLAPTQPDAVDTDTDGSLLAQALSDRDCNSPMLGQYWLEMSRDATNNFADYQPGIADTPINNYQAIADADVAMLQIGGWFDAAVEGQFEGQKLWGGTVIMGPWVHGNRLARGGPAYPNEAIDLQAETLRWFDYHAKGIENGADQMGGVYYYRINASDEQEWQHIAQWPPTNSSAQRFYLSNGSLSLQAPGMNDRTATYRDQNVQWFDGRYTPLSRWWEGDMSESASLSLTHTLPVFTEDTEVSGTPSASLWVSADVSDLNLFAVIEDVSPDGHASYVTDGRIRASWRKINPTPWGESGITYHRGFAEDLEALAPGEAAELVFDFFPISYVFGEGHQLRLSITTSIGEEYQAPPAAKANDFTLTLYRDAQRPSSILLPMIRD